MPIWGFNAQVRRIQRVVQLQGRTCGAPLRFIFGGLEELFLLDWKPQTTA